MSVLDNTAPGGGVRWGTPTGRAVLAAATLGSGLTLLDGTVVNVALKTIGEDLDASLSQLQWVTNGYLLSLASLILLGGSLGDRFGRRRIFVVGTVWFAVPRCCAGWHGARGLAAGSRRAPGCGRTRRRRLRRPGSSTRRTARPSSSVPDSSCSAEPCPG